MAFIGCNTSHIETIKEIQNIEIERDINNAFVKIAVEQTLMCLTTDANNNIVQEPCIGLNTQKILIDMINKKTGTYRLRTGPYLDHCFEVADPVSKNGTRVKVEKCEDKEAQYFRLIPSKHDKLFYKIVSVLSNKCLDINNQSYERGANFHQWACFDVRSQSFLLDRIPLEPRKLPKKVWTYWDRGEDQMPAFYQANVDVWRKRLGTSWSVIVLNNIATDANYIGNYFDKDSIPTISVLDSKISKRTSSHKSLDARVVFSDFVRLEILNKEGGFWMDPSNMLHKDLSEFVIPLENLSSFTMGGYTSRDQATSELRFADSLENFFIVSFPHNPLIEKWQKNFKEYWRLKTPDMSIDENPMYNGSMGLVLDLEKFGILADYLNQHAALKYTLIRNPEFLKEIMIRGDVKPDENGPFTLLYQVNFADKKLVTLPENYFPEIIDKMKYVLISKFPSNDSHAIRNLMRNVDDFFETTNIFGKLNSIGVFKQ